VYRKEQAVSRLAELRRRISNTAAYGGLTRGPRLVGLEAKKEMEAILAEVQSGRFAEEWLAECRSGKARLKELSRLDAAHPSEAAGRRVREIARHSGLSPADGSLVR